MKRLLLALGLLFCAANAGAQTTTFNGVVKDLTNTPVPTGQVTFQLKPGIDTTISGSSRFVPATTFCEIHNPGVVSTSGTGTITVVVDTAQNWLAGDSLIFVGTGDATLNASSVASPYTITTRNSSTSFVFTQSGAHTNGAGGTVGGLYKSGGTGACAVLQNSAITPQATSYTVGIQAIFAQPSSFNTYAIGAGPVDISTVVPTPSQMPAYSFVDTVSQQIVTGAKSFTNPCTIAGLLYVTAGGCYPTPSAAQTAMAGGAGLVYVPAGTYIGIVPASNQTFICLASPENAAVVNGIGITPANTQTQCVFTYTSTVNWTSVQNAHLVGLTLRFSNLGIGMAMTSSSFNRLDDVTLEGCGDTAVPCLTITTSGAGPGANSVHNDFNRTRILCNTAASHYCQSGIQVKGVIASTAFATVNHFYNTLIIGNLLGCIDHEANSDTNYYFDTQCFQMLAIQPANSYVLGFNLNTPGSSQDADGNLFQGVAYTAATNPTSYLRAGIAFGNVIEFAASGNPSVTNLGGANFYAQNTLRAINLSVSAFVTVPLSVPGYTQIARLSVANGTQLTSGNVGFTAGFGNTANPVVTSITGTDGAFTLVFTSGGAALGANPGVNLTFADGTFTNPPVCVVSKADASAPTTYYWAVSVASPTVLTYTFVGTPAATTSYAFTSICMKKPN